MVTVSDHLSSLLWKQAVRVAIYTFVEVAGTSLQNCIQTNFVLKGFAAAKKCTNEGRALMQLDFRQFVIQVKPAIVVYI